MMNDHRYKSGLKSWGDAEADPENLVGVSGVHAGKGLGSEKNDFFL